MKQNLVGKILGKIKIFGQDFVTIVTGITATFYFLNEMGSRKSGSLHIAAIDVIS